MASSFKSRLGNSVTALNIDNGNGPEAYGVLTAERRTLNSPSGLEWPETAPPKVNALASTARKNRTVNAMTVDVEDYFQVSAFEKHISRSNWDKYECRVESNVCKILELFSLHNVKATFFTLGWIAERYPNMVKRIAAEGHEIASHGWDHRLLTTLNPQVFYADVVKTRDLLEDISGNQVTGYRAPSYSVNTSNLWVHDVLAEAGYQYSSSIAPVVHDLYGMPDAPRFLHKRGDAGITEIPITTVKIGERNVPCGGGGWFRLYPYELSRWALNKVNTEEQEATVFYFHPWEFDPDQPRLRGIDLKTRFRHYVNLKRTQPRVAKLLEDFAWDRMDQVFDIGAARTSKVSEGSLSQLPSPY